MRPQPKNHITESSYKNYIQNLDAKPLYGTNIGGSSKFSSTKVQNFLGDDDKKQVARNNTQNLIMPIHVGKHQTKMSQVGINVMQQSHGQFARAQGATNSQNQKYPPQVAQSQGSHLLLMQSNSPPAPSRTKMGGLGFDQQFILQTQLEHQFHNEFGLNVEKYESKVQKKIDELKQFDYEEIKAMTPLDTFMVIQRLQDHYQKQCAENVSKQQRIDELIRDQTRLKLKLKKVMCPICLNGEKIPDAIQRKLNEAKKENDRDFMRRQQQPQPTQRNTVIKKQIKEESEDEYDEETAARIKLLERGRKGFQPAELRKIKYNENLEDLQSIAVPFNPKLDMNSIHTQSTLPNSPQDQHAPPEVVYGPRDPSCPCCEMDVKSGTKFLFLKCCRSVYHQRCIGVWLSSQRFCPNKACAQIIQLANIT